MLVRSPGTRASEVREKKKEPESNRDQAGRDQIIGDHFALFHLQNEMYIYIYSFIYPRQPASLQTCRSSGMVRGSHQCLTSMYLLIDNTTGCCMFFSYSVHHICLAQPAQIGVTNRNPTMKQLHQHPATD